MLDAAHAIPGAAAAPRFCPDCGDAIAQPGPCATCATRPAPALAPTIARSLAPIKHALAFYFVLLAYSIGAMFYAWATSPHTDRAAARFDLYDSAAFSLLILIAAILGHRQVVPALARTGPARWCLLAPVLSFATFTVASAVCYGAGLIFGWSRNAGLPPYIAAGYPWWTPLLLTAVQPAIFEELAFRGLIQSWLSRALGRNETLIVTAFLFATIHLNFVQACHVLVMGVVLSVLRQRSGSLYPGMILHFCHNSLVVLALPVLEHLR